MKEPLAFVIEKNNELILNEEVLKIIEQSENPRLLLFYGAKTRKKYKIKSNNKRKHKFMVIYK